MAVTTSARVSSNHRTCNREAIVIAGGQQSADSSSSFFASYRRGALDIRSAAAAPLLASAAWRDLDFPSPSQHAAADLIQFANPEQRSGFWIVEPHT